MKFSTLLKSSVALATCLFAVQQASAENNCNFLKTSKAWTLQGACYTRETIVVPKGISVNGGGFRITARDPIGGNFQGPILTNAAAGFNVANLVLRTDAAMANFCSPEAGKLYGILINETASNIVGVNITMNKAGGTSVCQEGVAIRAQGTGSAFYKVTIKDSILNYNQLGGVEMVGSINGRVDNTLIKSDQNGTGSPVPQRGINVALGAKAYLINNQVLRFKQVPITSNPSYGILMDNAGASTVYLNTVSNNDVGIAVRGGDKKTIRENTIRTSTQDGILLTDILGTLTTANVIWANDSQKNGGNGIYLQNTQDLLTKNTVKNNITRENFENGIYIEGIANKTQSNNSQVNHNAGAGFYDIADAGQHLVSGERNAYSQNKCLTSFAPNPVMLVCLAP